MNKKKDTPTIKKNVEPKATVEVFGEMPTPEGKYETKKDSPVRSYRHIKVDSNDPGYVNRVLVATPTTGCIRMEWALARWGQTIPMNWSQVQMVQYYNSFIPFNFTVPDAQNVIVKAVVEQDFEWLLLIEHDNIIPADAFIRFNQYMREEKVPIVSGLYFSRSNPSEPLVFRGRGTSVYTDWKQGERVWVDAVPTGTLLVHAGILREMWKESPEYVVNGVTTRRVFDNPRKVWYDTEGNFNTLTGTSDLEWCTRIMDGHYFKKAGWKDYDNKKYPFLIDTGIFVKHIDLDGTIYPDHMVSEAQEQENADTGDLR
jgi:hypothetical protein